jgi:hypothetical protein
VSPNDLGFYVKNSGSKPVKILESTYLASSVKSASNRITKLLKPTGGQRFVVFASEEHTRSFLIAAQTKRLNIEGYGVICGGEGV